MASHVLKWQIEGKDQSFALGEGSIYIGRRSDSEVMLLDPYVSRRHASVEKHESGYLIRDLGSTHGTFVNGERIEQDRSLEHGDRIQLGQGRVELTYYTHRPLEAQTIMTTLGDDEDTQKSALELTSVFPTVSTEQSELEKISHILDFQYHWEKSFSPEKTFQQLLESALKISGAERGFVLIQKEDGFNYVAGMEGNGEALPQTEFKHSRTIVDKVASQREALFMTEGIDQQFASQDSIVAMHLRAVACMPLIWISAASETPAVHGILYLDSTKTMHALSGLDQKILNKLALEAAGVFEKLEMLKSFEERKAVEKELALAQETQRSLLPQAIPAFQNFSLYAFSHPTRYVGGDFYDFLRADEERLTGVLADVSGKGVSAALLSSFIQGALAMECRGGVALTAVLDHTNKHLCRKTQSNRFVTLFLFSLDTDGNGEYLSAGHNPAYLFRAAGGQIEELASQDLILGAFDFATYQSMPLRLEKGDILVVYTDGVTEAENPAGDMFGEQRLMDLVSQHGKEGGGVLEDKILEAVEGFTEGMAQTDDITFMLVENSSG